MNYRHELFDFEKYRKQERLREDKAGGFRCSHCKQWVVINDWMGSRNRNHCNICFWSKHVDEKKGDRTATCHGGMKPIGLTFKHEGIGKQGEIMLIHLCCGCQKLSINRIVRDDPEPTILDVFNTSLGIDGPMKTRLKNEGIYLLIDMDRQEVMTQLYGKM